MFSYITGSHNESYEISSYYSAILIDRSSLKLGPSTENFSVGVNFSHLPLSQYSYDPTSYIYIRGSFNIQWTEPAPGNLGSDVNQYFSGNFGSYANYYVGDGITIKDADGQVSATLDTLTISSVPEPSSLSLLFLGGVVVALGRKR